ncbi:permeases of the drug/metabolite transporter (DMT) superfamily [Coriobacteriaceae bacterium EMTCatB1]|nr:permeases of the drug/metabolite transporter (DMT) superfamily [Coriobacteriaceae bacterium EMTCatB1]
MVVKDVVARYPVNAFLAWRFALATTVLAAAFPKAVRAIDARTLRAGALAGVLLAAGYVFQTWGLEATSASKAAFVTGMFVVITPVLQAVLLRHTPRVETVAGVAVATIGLWLLSGGPAGGWNAGDTRVLLCAVAYSFHMIVLGSVGRRHDAVALTIVQLAVVALLTGALSIGFEGAPLPADGRLIAAIVLTAVLGSAVAFVVQTHAQRTIPPSTVALILVTEPAFGGLFGWLAGERIGLRGLVGAALILAAMVFVEVAGSRAARRGEEVSVSVEGPPVPLETEIAD